MNKEICLDNYTIENGRLQGIRGFITEIFNEKVLTPMHKMIILKSVICKCSLAIKGGHQLLCNNW